MSKHDWERQRAFVDGHLGDITAVAWSPNGALLLSAGTDRKVLLWETKTQKILARYEYPNVMSLAWHPFENIMSFTTTDGELFIYKDFVPAEHAPLLEKSLQPAPFIHDPLADASTNARRAPANGSKELASRPRRRGSVDSLDDILGSDVMDEDDDFIEDDDGAGYATVNGYGKRSAEALDGPVSKRRAPQAMGKLHHHASFQPGSTPWRGNRRYLGMPCSPPCFTS